MQISNNANSEKSNYIFTKKRDCNINWDKTISKKITFRSICKFNWTLQSKDNHKKYDIPSNKYSLKNAQEIRGIMNEYYPNLIDKFSENTVEMLDF